MARPRAFDEATVLEQAMEVFWPRGFEAVSIDDLVAATGLSRSSIYQAFTSKRGLFEAALNHYVTERIGVMVGGLEADDAGPEAVVAFFETLDHVAHEYPDRYALGCLMTNAMAELGHADPAARQAGTIYVNRLRDAFANALSPGNDDQGRADGGKATSQAQLRAELLTTLALGAFVRARGTNRPDDARPLTEIVEEAMTSWW